MLKAVLPFTAAQFARGIIMPNLVPPVTTVAAAAAYRERILAARPAGSDFQPLMTCYLTDATTPDEIEKGFAEKVWVAAKLYPAGATTNAHYGVTDIAGLPGVRAHGEDRHAGAYPWRSDRSGHRYFRPRSGVHGAELAAAAQAACRAESRYRTRHDGRNRDIIRAHAPRVAARSRRTISSSTARRCFRAACGRISIACRSLSASVIGWRCARPRPPAQAVSSSAPTPRRT